MDDGVFKGVAVTEVLHDRLHVGVVKQLDYLAHAKLVEVNAFATRCATVSAD